MSLDDIKPFRMLVAVDGSEGSYKALQKAADMAKDALAYEIVVLYVIEVRELPALISDTGSEEQERMANNVMEDVAEMANSQGIVIHQEKLRGHPAHAVLDYAEQYHPDMILVGSRGMNAARRALVGSVSSTISRKAKHPVLVVR